MPSSSIDNCARLNDTTPWSALGQTKRPRSNAWRTGRARHHPTENFDEIAAPARKTKTCRSTVLFEHGLRGSTETGEAAPHVSDAGGDPDVVPVGSEIIERVAPG